LSYLKVVSEFTPGSVASYNTRRRDGLNPLTPTAAMSTALKHPVPNRDKRSFVIFDNQALWRSAW